MKYLLILSVIILIILIIILLTENIYYFIINIILYSILIIIQSILLYNYYKIEKINKENCKKILGSNNINDTNNIKNLIIKNLNKDNIYYQFFNELKVNTIDLNKLFNDTIEYGKLVRKHINKNQTDNNYTKIDGLLAWNTIKPYIEKFKCNNNKLKWIKGKDEILKLYNYVYNELNMKGDDNDEKNSNWEKYHFFLQLFRIPKNKYDESNEIILRVVQIGYNIGQMNCELYDNKAIKWLNNEFKTVNNNKLFYFINNNCKLNMY
jgi:hypothetical protein